MLKLQEFLKNGGTLEELYDKYRVRHKRHGKYPNLIQFKYWIDAPMSEEICQEARGLILDEADNWKIICYTFRKFFNIDEPNATPITDWENVKVYEKLDGSHMQLYYYKAEWHVASSGIPDASGPVTEEKPEMTFASLFWETWDELRYKLPEKETDVCFAFELITEYNRIICRYERPRIVLLGARDRVSLNELKPEEFASFYGWECVKSCPLLNTSAKTISYAATLDPLQDEGFVAVCGRDKDLLSYARVKIKSPKYVFLTHLKEGLSNKRLLETIQKNESEEFLSYFPEYRGRYEAMKSRYETFVALVELLYREHEHISDPKEYAKAVLPLKCNSILFRVRNKKAESIRVAIQELRLENLMEMGSFTEI